MNRIGSPNVTFRHNYQFLDSEPKPRLLLPFSVLAAQKSLSCLSYIFWYFALVFEEAFFYCDPPYSKGCGYEVTSTENFDHERLREVLGNIQGRFLLSYDDSPKIRELYKGFEMIEVERLNGINNKQGTSRENKIFKELLIANYPIKERHHAG